MNREKRSEPLPQQTTGCPVCSLQLSMSDLRDYLFRQQVGRETSAQIDRHLAEGCQACAESIEELNIVEPFLREKREAEIRVLVDTVAIRPETAKRQSSSVHGANDHKVRAFAKRLAE